MSADSAFPHLFSSLMLREVELRNRIVVPPHGNGLATHEFLPSERQAYYFAEKAKGGVGMIVWGGSVVHRNSIGKAGRNFIGDERAIPGYRFANDLIHSYGAKVFAQLSHQGRQQTSRVSRLPTVGPSPIPDPLNRQVPKEMDEEDMAELVEAFRKAALVAMEGGFDGVELYAAHGYLLSQFLTPIANQRSDRYGGELENRLRFPLEVMRAVREVVGSRVPVGLRINGSDFVEGGLTVEDMVEIAPLLVERGELDYLSVSGGTYHNMPLWIAEMSVPAGVFVPQSAAIAARVPVPVVAVNRIADPAQAEEILARGFAGMVGVNRAIIADPLWAEKARTGRVGDIRRCTFSNQGCMARATAGLPIGCLHNASIGYEQEWGEGTLEPAAQQRRVVVVGGGPGGMEAARVAALRGHRVTLIERAEELGGQIRLILQVESRSGFGEITAYYRDLLPRLGVELRLGVEADLALLSELHPDVVVFATGASANLEGYSPSRPARASLPGARRGWVYSAADALNGRIPAGAGVLIYDEQSDADALLAAEYLLDHGHSVRLVTRLPHVGQGAEYDITTLTPQLERLFRHRQGHFSLQTLSLLSEIHDDYSATFGHVYSKEQQRLSGIGALVLVMGHRSENWLYRQAKAEGLAKRMLAVGDCVAPRRITDAVFDAHRLLREV